MSQKYQGSSAEDIKRGPEVIAFLAIADKEAQ